MKQYREIMVCIRFFVISSNVCFLTAWSGENQLVFLFVDKCRTQERTKQIHSQFIQIAIGGKRKTKKSERIRVLRLIR